MPPSIIVAAYLVATASGPLTCLQDTSDKETSNSFLIEDQGLSLLIDAGWSDGTTPPPELVDRVASARTVATHLHYDHIRQFAAQRRILLSTTQASQCDGNRCDLSRWMTVRGVAPFDYEFAYGDREVLNAGVEPLACEGHSYGDSCFLHPASKTIFLGDLFYLGPLFAFLPGGSLRGNRDALRAALADPRWDRVAQTHGDCFATRADVERAAASLDDVVTGKVDGSWSFEFLLPLRVYPIATGAILLRPFDR